MFEIREAQQSDSSSLSGLLSQLGYDTVPAKIETLLSAAVDSDDRIYVGVLNTQVIAVMSVICFDYFPSAERVCRITSIVVDEEVRGLGLGSKLINYAKTFAVSEKCSVLEVTTSLRREQTQAYYESIGFQKTSYKYVQTLGEGN